MKCNRYQKDMYDDLMELVGSSRRKSFFYKDHEYLDDGDDSVRNYRIFNYRVTPSYLGWRKPGALECRGIMYEISDNKPIRLVCHPMEKFFNLNENPFTRNLDLSNVDIVEEKVDGSLISTFLTSKGTLRLKSKGSITSQQAKDSTSWIDDAKNSKFKNEIMRMTSMEKTVNMEWISPLNQIVVEYEKSALRVLNVRSNTDGSYLDLKDLPEWATEIRNRWTKRIRLPEEQDLVSFLEVAPKMKNIEGFVVRLKDSGMRVKIKTNWYCSLQHGHHLRRDVLSPSFLFKAVLENKTDDLKARLHDDVFAVERIAKMEDVVRNACSDVENEIERFHEEHRNKSRKHYAIAAQKLLGGKKTNLAMVRYKGDPVPYKKFLAHHRRNEITEAFKASIPDQSSVPGETKETTH